MKVSRILPWPILVLILLPLIPLGRQVFTGKSPINLSYDPVGLSGRQFDILEADGTLQFLPWRDLTFASWKEGKVPFWNPYQLAGSPLLANSQSAVFYPPHILVGLLRIPTGWGLTLLAWFHLAMAGIGVTLLARRIGSDEWGSLLAGATVSLSAFFIAWVPLASVISTGAWIPWLLVGLFDLQHSAKIKSCWKVALPVMAMLLGGHLQFAFYGALAGIIFGLAVLIGRSREKKPFAYGASLCFLAVLVGIGLASPQLVPTLKYSQESHRESVATADGYAAYVSHAVQPQELVGLLQPRLLGEPGISTWYEGAELVQTTEYWPMFLTQGAHYAESALYVGPVVLLGLLLIRKDQWTGSTIGLAVIGIVGLFLATGSVLNSAFYFGLPGFAATGSPGRASILLVLSLCTLAGLGYRNLLDPTQSERAKWLKSAFLITGGASLLSIVLAMALPIPPESPAKSILASQVIDSVPTFVITLALLAVAFVLWQRKSLMLVVACLLGVHLAAIPTQYLPASSVRSSQPTGDPNLRTAHVIDRWTFAGQVDIGGESLPDHPELMPNLSTLLRVQDIAGYDSLIAKSTVEIMREVNGGQDPAPPINGNMMLVKPEPDLEELKEAGVSTLYHRGEVVAIGGVIAEVDGKPVQVISLGTQGVSIDSPSSGHLTARYHNLPGWSATLNGQAVQISGRKWIEIDLPASGQVELKYTPPGLQIGYWIFAISALLLGSSVLPLIFKKPKETVTNLA